MERNNSLDGLKYVLISLVILGHFIEPNRYDNQISCMLYSIIYSFHMPLFIWMNGYFYKQRDFKQELKKSLPLIEICIISHVGFTLLGHGRLTLHSLLSFNYSPSWYMLSLFIWRMASSILFKSFCIRKLLICAIIVEIVSFVFINKYSGYFSLMRTLQFYPYFVAGYILKNKYEDVLQNKKILYMGGGNLDDFHIADFKRFTASDCFSKSRVA